MLTSQRSASARENQFHSFVQYAAENGTGAEGWSTHAITSRFDEMQLIYYAIKTRYTALYMYSDIGVKIVNVQQWDDEEQMFRNLH